MSNMKRIAQLSPSDPAYPNARWAVLSPTWVGSMVEVLFAKFPTLTEAIEMHDSVMFSRGNIELSDAAQHGDPMTIDKAIQWAEHVKVRASAGNKSALSDMLII